MSGPEQSNAHYTSALKNGLNAQWETRRERIRANCKILWGTHCNYQIQAKKANGKWHCLIVEDFGWHLGQQKFTTSSYSDADSAWRELDAALESRKSQSNPGQRP